MKKPKIIILALISILFVAIFFYIFAVPQVHKKNNLLKNKNLIERAKDLKSKGDDLDYQKKNFEAIEVYKKLISVSLILKDYDSLSYACNSIGICYKREKMFSNALDYYKKALVYAGKMKDDKERTKRLSSIYYNLALLFDTFNFYKKSAEFFNFAIDGYRKIGREDDLHETYGTLALIYRKMGDYNKAFKFTMKAYNYFLKKKNWYNVCVYANNLGYFYLKKGNLPKSEYCHLLALKLAKENRFKNMFPYIYSGMGELYFQKKDYKLALKYQSLAERTADDDLDVLIIIYRAFSDLYTAMGNEEKAADYLSKYNNLMLSCFKPENFEKFENLFVFFERERQKQKLALLEKEKKIQGLMGKLFFVGFVFVLALIWLIYYMYRSKQKMNAYLELLSKQDSLTGLSNRREMLAILQHEALRFERTKKPFSIAICDIDDFKKVNDVYGHSCGDTVLKRVADVFRENIRETDFVARWGGEEFLFFFPETDKKNAFKVVEKIRNKIAEEKFACEERYFSVSLTFGLCQFEEGTSLDMLIESADKALYLGKSSGKNRVVMCEDGLTNEQ